MNRGKLVFAQLMQHLPLTTFRRCVTRYRGTFKVKSFSCLDQFLCMAFAQLTYRESLRDIEVCLRAQSSKLYHLGIRSAVARNTLANANAVRDWRIYGDFAQSLIGIARPLYAQESFGVDRQETVYALDTTTIEQCRQLDGCLGRAEHRPRKYRQTQIKIVGQKNEGLGGFRILEADAPQRCLETWMRVEASEDDSLDQPSLAIDRMRVAPLDLEVRFTTGHEEAAGLVEAIEALKVEEATIHDVESAQLIDLRGNIPTFIHISDGKVREVNIVVGSSSICESRLSSELRKTRSGHKSG
jgi:hypothetical protein